VEASPTSISRNDDVYERVISKFSMEQRLLTRRRAVALQSVSRAVERGVVSGEVYQERHALMVEEELRKEVDRVLWRPVNAPPLRYEPAEGHLYVADWPIALDTRALTEEGRVILSVGLKCEMCGRRTFHHFSTKAHFEELIEMCGNTVPDQTRLSRDGRRRQTEKCVFCSNGVPAWTVL
jgi:hypothetical protein